MNIRVSLKILILPCISPNVKNNFGIDWDYSILLFCFFDLKCNSIAKAPYFVPKMLISNQPTPNKINPFWYYGSLAQKVLVLWKSQKKWMRTILTLNKFSKYFLSENDRVRARNDPRVRGTIRKKFYKICKFAKNNFLHLVS